jgi:hypothetical protein
MQTAMLSEAPPKLKALPKNGAVDQGIDKRDQARLRGRTSHQSSTVTSAAKAASGMAWHGHVVPSGSFRRSRELPHSKPRELA